MLERVALLFLASTFAFAQTGLKDRTPQPVPAEPAYQVETGTHILLNMINSVSTKQARVGDRIYLRTAFPVMVNGKIVIPPGSWVNGTVTGVQRPGHLKSKGELEIRFDTLTLPNGTTRNFHSDLGAVDGTSGEALDREHSGVQAPNNDGQRVRTVATTAGTGAAIGAGVGAISHAAIGGALIGGGAGAAAGLIGTMLAHRPDAVLPRGSTVEMVLDRPLTFTEQDLGPSR